MSKFYQSDLMNFFEDEFFLKTSEIAYCFDVDDALIANIKNGKKDLSKKMIEGAASTAEAIIKMITVNNDLCNVKIKDFLINNQFKVEDMHGFFKDDSENALNLKDTFVSLIKYATPNKVRRKKVFVESISLEDIILSQRGKNLKELWIVLESLIIEEDLIQNFIEIFKDNLKRGVNYTYFLLDTPYNKKGINNIKSIFNTHENQIKDYYLSENSNDENYFIIPKFGYSFHNPNDPKTRQGYVGQWFEGMPKFGGFRMHESRLSMIINELKKIKENAEGNFEK